MSYQIKSTPFFRRIVTTSKKNGELQKLKDEYDRIKEFNDRTIEMKMRQVRLKRLFREIEEIKETTSISQAKRRRAPRNSSNRTTEEIRVETFVKSKELGKEYSRLNALMERSAGSKHDNSNANTFSLINLGGNSKIACERRERTYKRINYGNEISRSNIEKIIQSPRKKSLKNELLSATCIDVNKFEKLQQRLSYGNSRSSINMARTPKRFNRQRDGECNAKLRRILASSIEETPIELITYDQGLAQRKSCNMVQTFAELQTKKLYLPNAQQLNEDAHARARRYWRKVALTFNNRLDDPKRRRSTLINLGDGKDSISNTGMISTDSNTLILPLTSKLSTETHIITHDNDQEMQQHKQLINFNTSTTTSNELIDDSDNIETEVAMIDNSTTDDDFFLNDSNNNKTDSVQNYVDILTPIVRKVVEDEAMELSAQNFYNFQNVRAMFQKNACDDQILPISYKRN